MKEVEKVSIGGYAFTIEKDASNKISTYISELERYYSKKEDGAEIMEGIEERIADLLMERCGKEGVANLEDIERIIERLGKPEEIEDEQEAENESDAKSASGSNGPKRKAKLYRDLEDKQLSGVCSGLAAYFGMDVVAIRLVFVAISIFLFLCLRHWLRFIGPIFYLALCICIPAAKTVDDKCKMHGDSGTIDDIENHVKEAFKEATDPETWKNIADTRTWSKIGRVLAICAGILLLVVGVAGAVGGSVVFFKAPWLLHWSHGVLGLSYREIARFPHWYRYLSLAVWFLPFIGILYGAMQLLFGFKSPKWNPGLVIFVLWLIVLTTVAVYTAISLTGNFLTI